jgi:CBS domain-containing protein
VVEQDNQVAGLLTLHRLKEIQKSAWPSTTAAQAMIPAAQMKSVQPDTELWTALEQMDRNGVSQLPVMTGGRLVGMLSREDVVSYLRTLQELGA